MALLGAASYSVGRIVAYGVIALVLMAGLASKPEVSEFLRTGIKPFLGPILILAGMVVADLLPIKLNLPGVGQDLMMRLAERGVLGEFLIGILFAISFCPVSAGLFFGSLIPLTLVSPVSALLVMAYGVGTALPVAVVAVLLVSSVQRATRLISSIESLQPIIIMFTAGLMIVIGLILTMESLFGWTLFG